MGRVSRWGMDMKIANHQLKDDDQLSFDFKTPNLSGTFANGLPDTVVIHFTGGSSAESSARHLCKPSAKASAHLVIGRDGKVYQLAPFNRVAWHAGKSTWKDRTGLNQYAIGIEIDNAGRLSDNGQGDFQTWFGKNLPQSEVFQGTHRNQSDPGYWHAYTESQIGRVFEVCELLIDYCGIGDIVGHEEIAPGRKVDPGPAFPLDKLRDSLLGDTRDQDAPAPEPMNGEAVVNASQLNIRKGPSTLFHTVSKPLEQGMRVRILSEQDGWIEVECSVRGWVSGQYLKAPD